MGWCPSSGKRSAYRAIKCCGRSDLRRLRRQARRRWFCTLAGLARREHARIEQISVDSRAEQPDRREHNALRAEHAYEDDQGIMWVQFARCLYRISGSTPEPLLRSSVRDIYGDRDGDLWAGTNGEGLIRFKDRSVRMLTTGDGLPSNIPMAVLSRHDGSLWVGTNCGGVSVYENQRFRSYSEKDGLLNSCVWSLAEDNKRQSVAWHLGRWSVPPCEEPLHPIYETRWFRWRRCARYSNRKRWFIVDRYRRRHKPHGERDVP